MRTRNGNHQDPQTERELAAVDATLGGQPVEAGMTELAELVLAVQAERPRPRPRFAEELDARAAAGFPRVEVTPDTVQQTREARQARIWFPRAFAGRRVPLAFGTAASLLIVVTAVVSSGVLTSETGDRSGSSDKPAVTRELSRESTPSGAGGGAAGSGAASDSVTASPAVPAPRLSLPSPRAGVLPQVRNRQQDRDAALVLATPRADVEDTADSVIQVTDRYQGFVLRSNVSGGDRGRAGATLELRIPSDRLQPALRDLSELAHVRSRTQTAQDITARFVSARSRLNEAVAERRSLLRQLARAATPNETASIRARLRLANRRIAGARSDLRGLRNRVDFSTVAVAIEADETIEADDSGWTPGDALRDALGILRTTLGIVLVGLAVLIPLSVVAFLAWFTAGSVRRGRRERALDSPRN